MARGPWLLAGALLPSLAAAVDIRNCSRLPQAGAHRYAFAAHGAQLRWQHDSTLCLDAVGGGATAVALRPCAGAIGWSRNATGSGGFMLSPAGDATRCLRAQPQFGAPLLLPCFADPWNAKLHTELSHPHGRLGASANPCCDKQPCGSAVCSAAVCAACPPSLGHCPQLSGTVWRLDADGRLIAQMSNPFQKVGTTHPVCSHFEGCLGEMAPLEVANGVQPLAWSPIPLSTPLRPTSGGWMHKQLRAQRAGFGGHEYPMAATPKVPASVYRDKWLGGDFASGMGNMLAEGYPYWYLLRQHFSRSCHFSDISSFQAQRLCTPRGSPERHGVHHGAARAGAAHHQQRHGPERMARPGVRALHAGKLKRYLPISLSPAGLLTTRLLRVAGPPWGGGLLAAV